MNPTGQVSHGPIATHNGQITLVEIPKWLHLAVKNQLAQVLGQPFSLLNRRLSHAGVTVRKSRVAPFHVRNVADGKNIGHALHLIEGINQDSAPFNAFRRHTVDH